MPMQKSCISQRGASSGPGKHSACSVMLSRYWWCTKLRNMQFRPRDGFLLLSRDLQETSRQPCGNCTFPHGCLDIFYRLWDKSKNPCLCGNCTFPNSVHHQNLESTWPAASCYGSCQTMNDQASEKNGCEKIVWSIDINWVSNWSRI